MLALRLLLPDELARIQREVKSEALLVLSRVSGVVSPCALRKFAMAVGVAASR